MSTIPTRVWSGGDASADRVTAFLRAVYAQSGDLRRHRLHGTDGVGGAATDEDGGRTVSGSYAIMGALHLNFLNLFLMLLHLLEGRRT